MEEDSLTLVACLWFRLDMAVCYWSSSNYGLEWLDKEGMWRILVEEASWRGPSGGLEEEEGCSGCELSLGRSMRWEGEALEPHCAFLQFLFSSFCSWELRRVGSKDGEGEERALVRDLMREWYKRAVAPLDQDWKLEGLIKSWEAVSLREEGPWEVDVKELDL